MSYEQSHVTTEEKKVETDKLSIKIYSPFKTFYEGVATSLSAENDTGPFDILPGHHNFISLIKPGNVIVQDAKGRQKFEVSKGIIHVKANVVLVFLDV